MSRKAIRHFALPLPKRFARGEHVEQLNKDTESLFSLLPTDATRAVLMPYVSGPIRPGVLRVEGLQKAGGSPLHNLDIERMCPYDGGRVIAACKWQNKCVVLTSDLDVDRDFLIRWPIAVAVTSQRLIVVLSLSDRIVLYSDPDDAPLRSWKVSEDQSLARDMAVDADDNVVIALYEHFSVYNLRGDVVRRVACHATVDALATTSDGAYVAWASGRESVYVISAQGDIKCTIPTHETTCVAVDASNHIVLAFQGAVYVYSREGSLLRKLDKPFRQFHHDIVSAIVDSTGRIVVAGYISFATYE